MNSECLFRRLSLLNHKLIFVVFLLITILTYVVSAQDLDNSSATLVDDKYILGISMDPIGFLTLGPSAEIEVAITSFMSVTAGARIPSWGAMTKSLYASMTDSWTIKTGINFYLGSKGYAKGFHIGPSFEYGKTKYEYESGSRATYQIIASGIRIGYKWTWKSGFSFGIADSIGVVFNNQTYPENIGAGWKYDMFVFYMLSFNFGFLLF